MQFKINNKKSSAAQSSIEFLMIGGIVLVFDIDGNKLVDDGSKIAGIIVVDVAKNFEQTRVMLNK